MSYQVIKIFVDSLIHPRAGSRNTSVLMSLGMNISGLLTHRIWATELIILMMNNNMLSNNTHNITMIIDDDDNNDENYFYKQ